MSIRDSYQKPQVEGTEFKKPFPLVDGKNPFRAIYLPQLAHDGKWFKFVAQHFGYKVTNRDGEDKLRTFLCPRIYDPVKKVEKHPCAECHKIERQKDLLTKRELQYKEEGLSKADIATKTQALRDWIRAHNRDMKYLIHVMNPKGEFGYVRLPSTAFYQLKDRIKEMEQAGIDLFDPNQGVWFSVNKSGKDFNTEYSTTIEMETELVNGRKMQTEKLAPLTDDQLEQALRECPQFDKLTTVITDRQIEQLAASNGSPEEATAIMGPPNRRENSSGSPARARKEEYEAEVAPTPVKMSAPVAASSRGESLDTYAQRVKAGVGSNAAPVADAVDPEQEAEEAALLAKLAALKARNKTKVEAPAQKAAPDFRDPATPAEEFIEAFGED